MTATGSRRLAARIGPAALAVAGSALAAILAWQPSAAAGTATAIPVVSQEYATNPSTADPYQSDPSAVHVAMAAGQETSQAYLLLDLAPLAGATPSSLTLVLVPTSDQTQNVAPQLAALEACPLKDPYPGSFQPSSPPSTDCTNGPTAAAALQPDGSWKLELAPLIPYWRSHATGAGLAVIPIPTIGGESFELAFAKKATVASAAGQTATASPTPSAASSPARTAAPTGAPALASVPPGTVTAPPPARTPASTAPGSAAPTTAASPTSAPVAVAVGPAAQPPATALAAPSRTDWRPIVLTVLITGILAVVAILAVALRRRAAGVAIRGGLLAVRERLSVPAAVILTGGLVVAGFPVAQAARSAVANGATTDGGALAAVPDQTAPGAGPAASGPAGPTAGPSGSAAPASSSVGAGAPSTGAAHPGVGGSPVAGAGGDGNGSAPAPIVNDAGVSDAAIKVGFVEVANSQAANAQFGYTPATAPSDDQYVTTLVNWVNGHGGVAGGRQIQVVRYTADANNAAGTDQGTKACTAFTQDDHVFAVVTDGILNSDCVKKTNTQIISNRLGEVSSEYLKQPSLYYAPSAFDGAVTDQLLVDGLYSQGFFSQEPSAGGPTKVGVIGFAVNQDSTTQQMSAALSRHGLSIADFGAEQSGGTAEQQIVLRFAREGITHVLAPDYSPLLFMQAAENQQYHPLYGLYTINGLQTIQQVDPAAQLHGARFVGWAPLADTDDAHDVGTTSSLQTKCWQIFADAGLGTARAVHQAGADWCDYIFLLATVLNQLPGRSVTHSAFLQAYQAIPEWASAITFYASFYGRGHNAGAHGYRDGVFDDSCKCFTYTSSTTKRFG